LPNCQGETIQMSNSSVNNKDLLIDGENENLFKVINLRIVLRDLNIPTCVPVVNIYVGKYKTYIYIVERGKVLKRSLITPDGKQINSHVLRTTDFVSCFSSK